MRRAFVHAAQAFCPPRPRRPSAATRPPSATMSVTVIAGPLDYQPNQGADMTTGMIIAIALFAVALMVIVILFAWVMINNRKRHRHIEADRIRERAKEETLQVNRREALAEETAAKARAVRAEASGLQQRAASHRNEAMTVRAELNQQFERADKMDPPSQTSDTAREDSETRATPALDEGR